MSRLTLNNNASDPSAPSAGKLFVYSKTDKQLYIEDDTGLVSQLATGSGAAVIGPALAVDNRIAAFDGTTGKLIKDSGVWINSTTGFLGIGGTPTAQLHISGNVSAAAWGGGIGIRTNAATYTDTSSSGTVASTSTHSLGTATIAASSAVTYTRADGLLITMPVAGTNVTFTERYGLTVSGSSLGTTGTVTLPPGMAVLDSQSGGTWDVVNSFGNYDIRSSDVSGIGAGTRARFGAVMENAAGGATRAAIFVAPVAAGTMVEGLGIFSNGDVKAAYGNLVCSAAGKGLQVQSGTGARAGDATLVGGTVTVTNTTVTANTKVLLSRKTIGGTVGNLSYTLSAGASFTINSSSGTDTSVITYMLVELN